MQTIIDTRKKMLQEQIREIELLEKQNEKFKKATPAQKRVMIAEDVLVQFQLENYVAHTGAFIEIKDEEGHKKDLPGSIQQMFAHDKIEGQCQVCEVGATFMSICRLNSDYKINGDEEDIFFMANHKFRNHLLKYYTPEMIFLMELAYEGGEGYFSFRNNSQAYDIINHGDKDWDLNSFDNGNDDEKPRRKFFKLFDKKVPFKQLQLLIIKALKFYDKWQGDENERLIKIQKLIIKNKGEKLF